MVIQTIYKLIRMRRFRSGVRRGLAAALSLALVLPMVSTFAANIQLSPIQVIQKADGEEFPNIEIEGNFVRDEFGFLTGYYELGLRVKTPENSSFTGLSVALQYDASILTPVDWSEVGADVQIENMEYYEVQLPTQKLESISTAAAHGGIPAVAAPDPDATGKKALMSFAINSYDPVEFPGDPTDPDATTLAVVRFRVKREVMDNISITKTSTGDYEVKCGKYEVTDIASLLDAFQNTTELTNVGTGEAMVNFASDDDIKKAGDESYNADAQMALDYRGGFKNAGGKEYINEYYHIPAYDPGDASTYDVNVQETIESKKHTFDVKPKTENNRVMAVDPDVADAVTGDWGNGKFSYTSNLIVNKYADYIQNSENYITFPIVSKRSFTDRANTLGNLTTIVYVDWDNTLLGTQVVPKNTDIRQLVSDHVAENFIYHDANNTTYGTNDLNNPLEAGDPVAVVSSLARVDNYRGKYTAKGPAAEGTNDSTVVTDGNKYALTNKLDYVFLKRPMTHTNAFDEAANPKPDPDDAAAYPGGVTDPDYIAALAAYEAAYDTWYWNKTEWSQETDDDGNVVWDTERPFAYGWAECTVDNYEDVWTTLGRGELGSATAVTEAGANGYGSTKGYNGANGGGYKAIPSTSVASVTYDGDAAFAFADLSKGFNKSMVFLKAVYEPGEGLQSEGYAYSMIKKPYYNKFNDKPADDGGAYMVSVTFERSTIDDDGNLAGTARLREPVVRQDTTTDLKWEESTTPLVNHNLTNANWTETYDTKSKTTYTKLDVPNSEEITLEMSFSARQNKVDYFLRENYGTNFVAAGERTNTNSVRIFGDYAVDNYNYYVNDTTKIPTDYYAPTAYTDREGTYGFVLFGTLNYMMEQATLYAHNEIAYDVFFNVVYYGHFDANLKDKNGNAITDIDGTMDILKNAALDAEGHKGAADAADYWNAERDCAELTYHQLQHYICDKGLLSRTAADADKIKWCHLHTACAALMSGKPQDWATLIAAAGEKSTAKLEMLTVDSSTDEIESKYRLRKDGNGTKGWTKSDFATKLIDAVEKLKNAGIAEANITWDQVQYVLDKGVADISASDMNDYGAEHYWWYDGKDLTSDLAAGETAFDRLKLAAEVANMTSSTQTLPDNKTDIAGRTAKLNLAEAVYNANTDIDNPSADWLKITENLTMGQKGATGEDAGKVNGFVDFDDFSGKLTTAVAALGTGASWHEVQYYMLHTAAGGASNSEYDTYWWHNGGINIADLATLLKAAKAGGDAWDGVSFTTFDNLNLGLAADLKGTAIDSGNFDTIKGKLAAYANETGADLTNNAWDAVQYYIIHGAINAGRTTAEKPYYWWVGDSSRPKTAATFTPSGTDNKAKADDLAVKLSEAFFKGEFNGYSDAEVGWTGGLQDSDLQAGRLAKAMGASAAAYPTDFTLFSVPADLSALKAAVKTAFEAANGGSGELKADNIAGKPYTCAKWEDIQKALIPSATELWWKEEDSKGVDGATAFAALQAALSDYINDREDSAKLQALKDAFTVETAKAMGFIDYNTGEELDQDKVGYINDSWDIYFDSADDGDALDDPALTWEQIQFLIISEDCWGYQTMLNPDNSADALSDEGIDPPDWYTPAGASFVLRAPKRLSPQQKLAQQTAEAKELAEALSIAMGDPALAAKLLEDEDFMANFAVIAEAMGYTKEKTEEKVPEKEPEKTPEKEPVYGLDKDTDVYEIETGEQKQEEKKQEEQKQEEQKQEEQKQEERQEQETTPSADEDKETVENTVTGNKTTTVDNITEDQTEEELTTNADNQIPETGQGDGSILDTSQAGVDPPPDEGPPQIIGIVIIDGYGKLTKGVVTA